MNVLIAPDKFKGSLTAWEVAEAIKKGILSKDKSLHVTLLPIADGGDGSLDILKPLLNLNEREVKTIDALGNPIKASYLFSDSTAFIEVASATGIASIPNKHKNPYKTSTIGTGLQIKNAIKNGATEIKLFLGGSSTNDAGIGILHSLGFRFLDANGAPLSPTGENLCHIRTIDKQDTIGKGKIKFSIYCDVNNPMYGPDGAAFIFAPQKGADHKMVMQLDAGLKNIATLFKEHKSSFDPFTEGYGAAGAIASGLCCFYNSAIESGFKFIAKSLKLEKLIKQSDIIISGEGKLDLQSSNGKVIGNLATLCTKYNKPLHIICGHNELSKKELEDMNIARVSSISSISKDIKDAFANAEQYIVKLSMDLL